MDLDPYQPTFADYQRRIKKSHDDFFRLKKELERDFPAGPNKIWDYDDEKGCMRKLTLPEREWEPFELI